MSQQIEDEDSKNSAMLWFEGSIPEAINSAKQRSLVFVVVIAGDDEQSKQLMSSWEDVSVSQAAQNCCVAIKVDAKSDTCVQFSQIYPVVCVPSSFFIGVSGIPLEVIAGSVSPDELMKRINKAQKLHHQEIGGTAAAEAQDSFVNTQPSDNATREPTSPAEGPIGLQPVHDKPGDAPATKGSLSSSADEEGVSGAKPSTESSPFCQTVSENENLNSKVERLTKKLEDRQEQKKREQKENEIKKEVERRKMGKQNQEFKRKQDVEKTKQLLEERNREKAEEKAARERVKQQIAMDRAERAASYAKMQQDEKVAKQNLLQAKQADQEARREAVIRERSTISRIQFRLPDGSSFTNQFPSQSRLQEAWNFAYQEIGNRYGNFSLATMYPRHEFSSEDLNRTLLELELVPSASIVLLPSRRPASSVTPSSGFGIWAVLGTVFYPLLAVWRFLSSFLFATPYSASASRGQADRNASNSSPNQAKREIPTKQNLEMRPKDFKKEGKICRLRTEEDEDEDNNTWNGNSTQQM
ncbi:UBX domain-containing protein 4 isoform X1 [Cyprinodon tularosa]|uniref:UBX domain-containing protein 4 isoform X1 n=1 Tax=Cyprinodon tularosa TaxID=77115 RepID=UPI0018E22811|nr:UBX domain-containing protein 4 isoform X1 [Cyprinodon tularosa]